MLRDLRIAAQQFQRAEFMKIVAAVPVQLRLKFN